MTLGDKRIYPWKANELLYNFVSDQEKNILLGIADSPQTSYADIYTGKSLKFENWKPYGGVLSSIFESNIRNGLNLYLMPSFISRSLEIPLKPRFEHLPRDCLLFQGTFEGVLDGWLVRCWWILVKLQNELDPVSSIHKLLVTGLFNYQNTPLMWKSEFKEGSKDRKSQSIIQKHYLNRCKAKNVSEKLPSQFQSFRCWFWATCFIEKTFTRFRLIVCRKPQIL